MSKEPEEDEASSLSQKRAIQVSIGMLVSAVFITWGIREFSRPPSIVRDPATDSSLASARRVLHEDIVPPAAEFHEVASEVGLDWQHVSGANGEKYFPESMGSGIAWLDWDNDLDPDLIVSNAKDLSGTQAGKIGYVAAFENDGNGRFTNVTEKLGLKISIFGTGIAVGDYDGDGYSDVYFAALGKNRLYRNIGGERFEDVTDSLGVAGEQNDYSQCAGFFDADGDGDLDLIVGGYSEWNLEVHEGVRRIVPGFGRMYNEPDALPGQFGRIFRNDGPEGFTDLSKKWGVHVVEPKTGRPIGKNLGFGFAYLNEDRTLDVVVANDSVRNLLLLSRSGGGFDEEADEWGLGYDRRGNASGAMGIDIDKDPQSSELRIAIGNFLEEMTSLYLNLDGKDHFVDETVAEGVGPRTNNRVTFGMVFADYDLDGFRDIFEVNGGIDESPALRDVGITYRQPGDIFWYCGTRCRTTYVYLGRDLSGDFANRIVGRGLAVADFDGDGDLDLAATGIDEPLYLYRNDSTSGHHWLRVKLRGYAPNPEAIGAELILTAGQHRQYRLVQPSHSYLSSSELVQTFGLGEWSDTVELQVTWPDGKQSVHTVTDLDRVVVLDEPQD